MTTMQVDQVIVILLNFCNYTYATNSAIMKKKTKNCIKLQKRALIKLKHDLEPFRNAIVGAYGVLTWEKQYYAGVVFGAISIMYLLLWYMDLSFITLFSLLALLAFFMDFVIPMLSRLVSSGDKWDGEQEAKFEEVCGQLYSIKSGIAEWYDYLFKERKPTMVSIKI